MAVSNESQVSAIGRWRIYEMIPGLITWSTFIFAIALSFIRPLWVIYFIIIFDLYWLFRVSYFVFYILLSWQNYRRDRNVDWQASVESLPNWRRMYHCIFLPTYNESLEVLQRTLRSLAESRYPHDRMIVVLTGEERAGREKFLAKAEAVRAEFGATFFKLIIISHPANLPDEIPGKGSNINYAGHEVKKIIDGELHIPYADIIVSSFDIDTRAHPQYFSCVTYKYLTHPHPTRTSYQPIALYNNNMWESDAILRVAAFGTTFWLMTDLMRPERLFTFSSHSMSWQMLVDVDFWEKDIVTEDSRIFLQGFLRYDGDYTVTPIFVPVSMNTVATDTWWQGLKALYQQQRRWAWGVEHIPYMMWHFRQKRADKKISWSTRVRYLWNLGEGMYSWATVPILITILGRLPLYLAEGAEKATVVAQNAPFVLQWLMTLAMAGIFISGLLSLALLPPRPQQTLHLKYLIMALQWVLLPVTLILFGSIPATDAQTRLMLGGKFRLGFWVSPKERS
ncbi:glycosyltransferase family 2 protein [Candidatus Falkowbacteria bacterium]|nr:glycosyltransferase family 2 protein [Candidatus Falkowbacteria bacterium]